MYDKININHVNIIALTKNIFVYEKEFNGYCDYCSYMEYGIKLGKIYIFECEYYYLGDGLFNSSW